MSLPLNDDSRIVMTLDAGGTNLEFSAIRGNQRIAGPIELPSEAANLNRCLDNLISGFDCIRRSLPEPPAAISFAFPGPADYPAGVIVNIGNLPAFQDAVALGPMLEKKFGIPVFINNDGDLFVYGESIAGFLPYVNHLLEQAGNPKRYRNLFGITLGTGLGGGIVHDHQLFLGDNSAGAEAWLLRNKLDASVNAEEGASIRAVRRVYACNADIPLERAPEPRVIFEIAKGRADGDHEAALRAFQQLGEVAGDVLAQALTLVDGLAVIGGGISGAHDLFLPSLVEAMNGVYERKGNPLRRLVPRTFNFEDLVQREEFLRSQAREITVPGSDQKVSFDPLPRTAVGISRLGTSHAVAIGAYAFALARISS